MNRSLDPATIAPSAANYAHGVQVQSPAGWVFTSGVVPVMPDGTVPEAVADQAAAVWANITAILDAGGLRPGDIVSVTTYVVAEHADLPAVMAARDATLGDHRAASTLVTVPRLADIRWKVEIAVVAAR
jgi:2-iminobutanoate/2-iminopropanoate deaminase